MFVLKSEVFRAGTTDPSDPDGSGRKFMEEPGGDRRNENPTRPEGNTSWFGVQQAWAKDGLQFQSITASHSEALVGGVSLQQLCSQGKRSLPTGQPVRQWMELVLSGSIPPTTP
eukprot:2317862-Amphidinium_carterae.1